LADTYLRDDEDDREIEDEAFITVDDDLTEQVAHEELVSGLNEGREIDDEPYGDELEDEDAIDWDAQGPEDDFYENLAERLTDNERAAIAREAIEIIEQDDLARQPWLESQEERYKILGLVRSDMDDGPFKGSANIVYQGLIESAVRWSAGALNLLLPEDGPVKVNILGSDRSEEQKDRAERVERHENFSCMKDDEAFIPEIKRAVMRLPIDGSVFFYSHRDPDRDTTASEFIDAEDLIAPYGTVSLETVDHFTRRIKHTHNQLIRLMASKYYRTAEIPEPEIGEDDSEEQGERAIDKVEKVENVDDREDFHILYEYHANLDIPNFEDEHQGEATGIHLPYRVCIHRKTEEVLAIYRDWRPEDPLKLRRQRVRKIDFLPGYRFYGLSLYDLIGMMSWAGTGALRLILDGSLSASIPGGFKTKEGSKLTEDRVQIEPNTWKSVGLSYDEIQRAFYTPPTHPPSPALFSTFQLIDEGVRRLGQISDIATGTADNKAPVGTTMALLEEAHKVTKATHLHVLQCFTPVLRDRHEINQRYLPPAGFNYAEGDQDAVIFEDDYGPDLEIDVRADRQATTTMERVVKNQNLYQLSMENPGQFNHHEILKRLVRALEPGGDIDEILPDPSEVPDRDPVTEAQAMLVGKPIKAFQHQDHRSHIQVHLAMAQNPGLLGHPEVVERLGPVMQAHMAEHLGYLIAEQVAGMGVQLQPWDPEAEQELGKELPQDPQFNNMVAQQAAQMAEQLAQMQGLPPPPPPPPPPEVLKQQEHEQKMGHRDQEHQQKIGQEQEKHQLKLVLDQEAHQQEMVQDMEEHAADIGKKSEDRAMEIGERQQDRQMAAIEQVEDRERDVAAQDEDRERQQQDQDLDNDVKALDAVKKVFGE
jgi:hypothetical protein